MQPDPFISGYRLIDGDELNDVIANPSWSVSPTVSATPGGTVNNSVLVNFAITNVATVSAPGAGIALPQALPGRLLIIQNNGVNALTMYAQDGSSIVGVPGNIGVTVPAGTTVFVYGLAVNEWSIIRQAIISPPVLPGLSGYLYSDGVNPVVGVPEVAACRASLLHYTGTTGLGPGDSWLSIVQDDLALNHNDSLDPIAIRYNGAFWPVGGTAWNYAASVLQAYYGWSAPTTAARIAMAQAYAYANG